MSDREVRTLLSDRPETETDLRSLLAAEEDHDDPWTFDDVPVGSGLFGELVDRGIVESVDDGYRLADPDAVRAALEADVGTETDSGAVSDGDDPVGSDRDPDLGVALRRVLPSPRVAAALGGVFLLALLARTVFIYGAVFRDGNVVLAGNDPWLYRHWVDVLLETQGGISPGDLGRLPDGLPDDDVLTVVLLWALATLAGGTVDAAGGALAWYPVIFGLATLPVLYDLTVRLSGDRRIGLAGVALLAVTPAHAVLTSVGVSDHDAVDLLLLSLVLWGLVAVSRAGAGDRERWVGAGVLGLAAAGQTLAWRGGPLLLIPVGVGVTLWALAAMRDGRPLADFRPLLAGLALAAVTSLLVEVTLDWVRTFQVFATPLLLAGVVAVLGAVAVGRRLDLSVRLTAGATAVVAVVTAGVVALAVPQVGGAFGRAQDYFARTGARDIAETQSLFNPELGGVLGPVLTFGVALFLGVGYLAWASWYASERYRPGWTVVAALTWSYLLFGTLQVRFAGVLALPLTPFLGVGFVHLLALIDVTDRPTMMASDDGARPSLGDDGASAGAVDLPLPGRQTVVYGVVLFLLLGGPGLAQTAFESSAFAVDDETYRASVAIGEYADERGLEFPQTYVLSPWGDNRVYNYFAGGWAASYGLARDRYSPFLAATTPANASRTVRFRPPGFVVTTDQPADFGPRTMQTRLHENLGSRSGDVPGLARYRLIHASEDGSTKVFAVVNGTTLVANATPGERVTLTTNVTVSGTSFTYRRVVAADDDGTVRVTVPYPGRYRVGNRTVEVSESEIED